MFVSPPPITNNESLSQSTISSLDSGLFGRNRADLNIQQQTTSEVSDIETVMDDNLISLIVRAFIVRYKYNTINYIHKQIMKSALFFGY